jgi:hypothetical protein
MFAGIAVRSAKLGAHRNTLGAVHELYHRDRAEHARVVTRNLPTRYSSHEVVANVDVLDVGVITVMQLIHSSFPS